MSIVVTSNQPKESAPPAPAAPAVQEDGKKTPAAGETAETLEASGTTNDEELETEEGDGADPALQAKPKANKGYKKRIDKLSKRAADAEQRASYLQGLLDAKKTPDGKKPDETAQASKSGEPDPDTFEHNSDYLKALTKWQIAEDRKESEKTERAEKSKSEFKSKQEHSKNSITEAKKKFKDFDDVVDAASDINLPDALHFLVMEHENPGELMYELAKDRETLEKISKLPLEKLERALGRFEARIEVKAAVKAAASEEITDKPTSKAPPPINPVGNKGAGAGKKSLFDPNLSQKEFESIVMEQAKSRASSW